MKKIFHKEVNTPNGMRVMVESYTRGYSHTPSFLLRYMIHAIVKLINKVIGYRIWKKGEVPEAAR